MSQQRVITGTDERGRPKAEWRPTDGASEPRYGHMEPASVPTITRRQATPDELEAARARETAPSALVVRTGPPRRPVELAVLGRLQEANDAAWAAWHAKQVADEAWDAAWEALQAACWALRDPDDVPPEVPAVPRLAPAPETRETTRKHVAKPDAPKRRRPRNPGGKDARDRVIAERAERVLAALERHGGNTKAAGAELGMRGNVVAKIANSARRRAARA